MTKFEIAIVSDTVCPWCYIGLRNLQAAIAQHTARNPGDTFVISWHPFQLNPHAPKGQSVEKMKNYESSFGVEGARMTVNRLTAAGKGVNINFRFGGRIGNTLDSHRLIEYAGRRVNSSTSSNAIDRQTRLAEELFADYFERELDITSHDVLTQAALRIGLSNDETEIKKFLASDSLADEVQRDADARRRADVNGVPHFTINDEFTVEGAQQPIAFLHLFDRLARKRRAALL